METKEVIEYKGKIKELDVRISEFIKNYRLEKNLQPNEKIDFLDKHIDFNDNRMKFEHERGLLEKPFLEKAHYKKGDMVYFTHTKKEYVDTSIKYNGTFIEEKNTVEMDMVFDVNNPKVTFGNPLKVKTYFEKVILVGIINNVRVDRDGKILYDIDNYLPFSEGFYPTIQENEILNIPDLNDLKNNTEIMKKNIGNFNDYSNIS